MVYSVAHCMLLIAKGSFANLISTAVKQRLNWRVLELELKLSLIPPRSLCRSFSLRNGA